MPENIENPETEHFDVNRLVDIVRRRHLQFLFPLLIGWLVVWGASWILPQKYKSSTLILVEQPSMPENYVAPNISDDLQTRLQSITTQILSRTRLLTIIDRLHLYGGMENAATADERVNRMRKDVDIELVRDPQEGGEGREGHEGHDPVEQHPGAERHERKLGRGQELKWTFRPRSTTSRSPSCYSYGA